MIFTNYKALHFQDIQNLCFRLPPFSRPVIALKKLRCDLETLSIDRALNKEHFHGKVMWKMYKKLVPEKIKHNFGKQAKTAIACKKLI